jgi:hypothetical protein
VSVLDKRREPIRGLAAQDFVVLENGNPQPIVAFSERWIAEPEASTASWVRKVSSDVQSNGTRDGRLLVLVLDDATIPFDPLIVNSAKQIAREIVRRMGINDQAAVVFTRDNRNAQNFTGDRERLLAAIERFTSGFALPGGAWRPTAADWELYYRASLRTVRNVSEHLGIVRERSHT